MPQINFTPNLERHIGVRRVEVAGATLKEALTAAFASVPLARSYILDDQGAVRHHVAVFVDGQLVHDRKKLEHPLANRSEVWIMQALSGG